MVLFEHLVKPSISLFVIHSHESIFIKVVFTLYHFIKIFFLNLLLLLLKLIRDLPFWMHLRRKITVQMFVLKILLYHNLWKHMAILFIFWKKCSITKILVYKVWRVFNMIVKLLYNVWLSKGWRCMINAFLFWIM